MVAAALQAAAGSGVAVVAASPVVVPVRSAAPVLSMRFQVEYVEFLVAASGASSAAAFAVVGGVVVF